MSALLPKMLETEQELKRVKTPILTKCEDASFETKRNEIISYFEKTFELEEKLFQILKDDSCFYKRYEPLRHPLIFYYGHTTTFFINKFIFSKITDNKRLNPEFERMFATGVDENSWDDTEEGHYNWPKVEDVRKYRQQAKQMIVEVMRKVPLQVPITWQSPWWTVMMGIEHARIHLETSSVIIRQAPTKDINQKMLEFWNSAPIRTSSDTMPPMNELVSIPASEVNLARDWSDDAYGWDNEYGEKQVAVKAFKASRYLVSNMEFLSFINDDGYNTQRWWTAEGWSWRSFTKAQHPRFWIKSTEGYKLRTLLEIVDMQWDWPVELNYLEAKAFCNWKSEKEGKKIRLPTEEEYFVLRDMIPTDQPYWKQAPGNINLEKYSTPCPISEFKQVDEPYNLYDIIGNVWQHCETWFDAFNNFKTHPMYDDFSIPSYDGKHNLIKGGSFISTGNEATKYTRQIFRRHFYQHAGFRYVEVAEDLATQTPSPFARFEANSNDCSGYLDTGDNPELNQVIELNYGCEEGSEKRNFFKAVADFSTHQTKVLNKPKSRALELGCLVGRTAFELARYFDKVSGLERTANLIQVANHIKSGGVVRYKLAGETLKEVKLKDPSLDIDPAVAAKVDFFQCDLCNVDPMKHTAFDLIVVNCLDRVYDPVALLKSACNLLNEEGVLIIVRPTSSAVSFEEVFQSLEQHFELKDEQLLSLLSKKEEGDLETLTASIYELEAWTRK